MPVATIATGNLKSAAILIFSAGQKGKRYISETTEIMVHQFHITLQSTKFHEIEELYKASVKTANLFKKHFKQNGTCNDEIIDEILFGKSDVYLNANDMVKYGLADHILEDNSIHQMMEENFGIL